MNELVPPLRAMLDPARSTNGISWIEIEAADGGYYLFQFDGIGKSPKADSFFQTFEAAKKLAAEVWGVTDGQWRSLS